MPTAHIDPSPDGVNTPAAPRNRAADDSAPGWRPASERGGLPAQFALRCMRRGSAHIIIPSGDLDLATAPALHDELLAAESTDADRIVLDLSALSFIDSTGLRTILQAAARANANGNRLRLLPGPPQIQRIFEITATTEHLPFTPAGADRQDREELSR